MKIPFDIKFRPQIESGEYKMETRGGMTARIICWDRKNNDYPIIALLEEQSGKEYITSYTQNGQRTKGVSDVPSDLFIITPEPELTKFEKAIETICTNLVSDIDKVDNVKKIAAELLAIAKKELCNGCSIGLDEYWRGRKEASEEASRGYHYEGPMTPVFWPPCIYSGECTNPFHDCFNCHRGATTVGINTTTGTSTSKVEG